MHTHVSNLDLRRKTLITHATLVYAGKLCLRMQPWFTQENSVYACNLGLRRKTPITHATLVYAGKL